MASDALRTVLLAAEEAARRREQDLEDKTDDDPKASREFIRDVRWAIKRLED